MNSNQLLYNLLPADRFANTNFRHTFLSLSILETLLTSCNATLSMLLSIYIYTRQPFILLHTSFHPFLQASIFMTSSISQFFKLIVLIFCTFKIILNDGEIFTACAIVEIHPNLELIQVEKSPNDIARKSFKKRQNHVNRLRRVIKLYPLLQLICGSLSLAFWCTSDERHSISASYYKLLERSQGPSNFVFIFYLTTWSADLIITPLFYLIMTWHYARVDWQIQLLAAQETMDQNLSRTGGREEDQDFHGERRRVSVASRKKKRKSRIKSALSPKSPFSPNKCQRQQQTKSKQRNEESRGEGSKPIDKDVHKTRAPISVPVSPCTSSSSIEQTRPSFSSQETYDDYFLGKKASRPPQNCINLERKLMKMTASIKSRRASEDLTKTLSRSQSKPARQSAISAYLNVEGADDLAETTFDRSSRGQDESDSFRICIEADDPGGH